MRDVWRRCAVGLVALLGLARAAEAQWVKVTPSTRVLPGAVTVDVTIDYCFAGFNGFGDPVVLVNGTDITGSVSITYNYATPPGCDDAYQATFTTTLPAVVDGRFLTSSNYLYNDIARYTLPAPATDVRVQAARQTVALAPSTAFSTTFTVVNTGDGTETYSLESTCAGAAVSGSCSVAPSTMTLAAGASGVVTLSGTATGTLGAQTVALVRATADGDPGMRDSSWAELTVRAAPAAGMRIVTATEDQERGACVALGAGAEASYECGDLRLVHALPATTRFNRTRTPALLYSSHTASPAPAIGVEVTRAEGAPTPSALEICVLVPAIGRTECAYNTPPAAGTTRRYTTVLDNWTAATGRYAYTVEVATTVSGVRTVESATGALAVVNRRTSPYGAGWWLTGIDQIVGSPGSADTVLWVGADGSTRVFGSVGYAGSTKRFVARTLDRPDTLYYNGTALYRRREQDRYTTYYSPSTGYYQSTVWSVGQVRDECGSMGAGGACLSWSMGAPYTFHFGATRLDSVTAPAAGSTLRRVRISGSGTQVTQLTDPDGAAVTLSYVSGTSRVSSRTDRRGAVTAYSWTNTRLSQVVVDQGRLNLTMGLIPAEVRGAGGGAGVLADSAYTEIDGPRSDVDDRTRLWLNAYGAPTRIRDPHGNETAVTYDATWPLLVQRLRTPTRLEQRAYYNARGLTDSVSVIGGVTGTDTATTRMVWDSHWRAATSVTDPTGLAQSSGYDATTGATLWQQVGPSSARRVTFTYVASGPAIGQVQTVTRPPAAAVDSFTYDADGNLARTRTALGFVSLVYRDAVGRDTLQVTPIDSATGRDDASVLATGLRQLTRYDVLGQDTLSLTVGPARSGAVMGTHPADTVWQSQGYDAEGNKIRTTRKYRQVGSSAIWQLQHTWQYDYAGRVTSETKPGSSATSVTYDPAGNVIASTSARGLTVQASYDALNRVTRRILPQVDLSSRHCSTLALQYPWCGYSLPTRAEVAPSSCIAADTLRYRYTPAGQIADATNRWARVRRSYSRGGLLLADTLRTRAWFVNATMACEEPGPTGASVAYDYRFDYHVYGLAYSYDAAGRRTRLWHPDAVDPCGGRCIDAYVYSATTGSLDSLIDYAGRAYTFAYDDGGRLVSKGAPGGVTDVRTYDLDDRQVSRSISGLIGDTYSLDAMGRNRSVQSGGSAAANVYYNGLGGVVATENMTDGAGYERFDVDGLGNRRMAMRVGARTGLHPDRDRIRLHTYDAAGRLQLTVDSLPAYSAQYDYERTQEFDASGNVILRGEREANNSAILVDYLASYYGADEKLALAVRHIGIAGTSDDSRPGARGVWEQTRYDALGRRVASYAVRGAACSSTDSECVSAIERTVWDGDQVLYEIRTAPETAWSDTPASGWLGAYGRVLYIHGGGIDQPLSVTRMDLTGQPAAVTLALHSSWQGPFAGATLMSGAVQAGCAGDYGCPQVAWAGGRLTVDGERGVVPTNPAWWGTLTTSSGTGSGLTYLRNRFYDPTTGQFTQADPIGLAGGKNLYAFAGGDPVNYADPFGLCPVCVGYALFEAASTAYDVYDLAKTGVAYMRGRASKAELAVTAAGVAAGVVTVGGGIGRAARETVLESGTVWRAGTSMRARAVDQGRLSARSSLSNEIGKRPVFRPGEKATEIDVSKLPPGSAILDSPGGHVSITASEDEVKRAIIQQVRIPKP